MKWNGNQKSEIKWKWNHKSEMRNEKLNEKSKWKMENGKWNENENENKKTKEKHTRQTMLNIFKNSFPWKTTIYIWFRFYTWTFGIHSK